MWEAAGGEQEGGPLVHAAHSVGPASPRRLLTSVFFPKIRLDLDWSVSVPSSSNAVWSQPRSPEY